MKKTLFPTEGKQDTVHVLNKFMQNIINKTEGFSLGDPWKYSKRSIGVVIPILCDSAKKKDYLIYPEVANSVRVLDSGSVSILNVENPLNESVFLKSGTLLKGISGQDRTPISSIILAPNSKTTIDCRCVHASRPTHSGGGFNYCGYTPRQVHTNLSKGQGETWESVKSYYDTCAKSYDPSFGRNVKEDDLTSIKMGQMKIDDTFKNILSQVPCLENQIGAVFIGIKGIIGVEVFNHPDSWKVQYKDAIESYIDVLAEQAETSSFKFAESKIYDTVKKFLRTIAEADQDSIRQGVFRLRLKGYIGEVTFHNGHLLHLFCIKEDDTSENNGKEDHSPFDEEESVGEEDLRI